MNKIKCSHIINVSVDSATYQDRAWDRAAAEVGRNVVPYDGSKHDTSEAEASHVCMTMGLPTWGYTFVVEVK